MKTNIKIIFVVLLMLGAYGGFAQNVTNKNFSKTIKEIAAFNIYETTCTVGFSNMPSTQYERFKLLASHANDEDLILLAGTHKNAVVRLYAFQALKKREIEMPASIVEKFKNDVSEVISLQGCLAENTRVNQLLNQIFIPSTTYKLEQQ